jgi:hypothetical protein
MAYPAYSFVVIDTTVEGVTTSAVTVYTTPQAAKAAYVVAVNAGKRAYLYEKPIPNLFRRNDSQPLP